MLGAAPTPHHKTKTVTVKSSNPAAKSSSPTSPASKSSSSSPSTSSSPTTTGPSTGPSTTGGTSGGSSGGGSSGFDKTKKKNNRGPANRKSRINGFSNKKRLNKKN